MGVAQQSPPHQARGMVLARQLQKGITRVLELNATVTVPEINPCRNLKRVTQALRLAQIICSLVKQIKYQLGRTPLNAAHKAGGECAPWSSYTWPPPVTRQLDSREAPERVRCRLAEAGRPKGRRRCRLAEAAGRLGLTEAAEPAGRRLA